MDKTYNHLEIEAKWAKYWDENKTYKVDISNSKKPFYNLAMFPYPSGEGLHVGHIIPYSGVDTLGRFKRMNGYDVFEPMGFDAFGIHSENFAIKQGIHPNTLIAKTTEYFREKQMKRLGTLFDWDREVNTTDPNYYKWTQWLFIQMFKHGLAEKRKAAVTYCPSCKTVLSDEQTEVKDGVTVCERCKTPIERKELEQWFFKITKYAQQLLDNLDHLDTDVWGKDKKASEKDLKNGINWSEKTKRAQRNWIGRSEGINITYDIDGSLEKITCFTTRPDTNFGATFIVVAPENKIIDKITTSSQKTSVEAYRKQAMHKSEQERIAEGKEKSGVFTGSYAINFLTGKKMPIWVSDFVISSVGTGAVIGVPGHDLRDFEFAVKFGLEIVRVVVGKDGDKGQITSVKQVQEDEGVMINSGFLNGLPILEAKEKIKDYIEKQGKGKRVINFRLRDWCISRQRYWGPPIPMINCPKCGWQTVPEKDLPVVLPFIEDYQPTGEGQSPLAKKTDWVQVKCPKCGGEAVRETDVSDTFLDSAWYFLRYPSVGLPGSDSEPWNKEITAKWCPIDMYIGGHEHAVLHLMYARFITMALAEMGFIDFSEPFKQFFAHGLLIKEGAKMSKSRGNVVNPNSYLDKYGADTLRLYILFLGPYDAGGDFRDTAIAGVNRFLTRVWNLVSGSYDKVIIDENQKKELRLILNRTIKKVTEDIENMHFNTAISALMEYYNFLSEIAKKSSENEKLAVADGEWQSALKTLLTLLAPFAPFVTEELWSGIEKSSVHDQVWPKFNEAYLTGESVEIVIQVNGKMREKIQISTIEASDQVIVEKMAFELEKIKPYLTDQKAKKVIFVPGKLLNIVI